MVCMYKNKLITKWDAKKKKKNHYKVIPSGNEKGNDFFFTSTSIGLAPDLVASTFYDTRDTKC